MMRGTDWDQTLTEKEMRDIVERTNQWFDEIFKTGKVIGGSALGLNGYTVSGKSRTVTDGPFAESKEAIGGYLVLAVSSLEEALEIAKTSPGLDYGISIEVRPALNECPLFKQIQQRLRLAAA